MSDAELKPEEQAASKVIADTMVIAWGMGTDGRITIGEFADRLARQVIADLAEAGFEIVRSGKGGGPAGWG
jgi:hypothetical protein